MVPVIYFNLSCHYFSNLLKYLYADCWPYIAKSPFPKYSYYNMQILQIIYMIM